MKWFGKSDPSTPPKDQLLLVVPVDATKRPEPASKEIRESIMSLQFHPGFQWLMNKFRFQSAVIESKLKREEHSDLKKVYLYQAMLGALSWHEQQVLAEVGRTQVQTTSAKPYEQELFEQVRESIEQI